MLRLAALLSLHSSSCSACHPSARRPSAPIRVAIVGLAHGHVKGFLHSFPNSTSAKLVAIVEPNTALAKQDADQYDLDASLFYTDEEAMLNKLHPDAVLGYSTIAQHRKVIEFLRENVSGSLQWSSLTIVAHDRFQEIVDLANSADSPLKGGFETVFIPQTKPSIVPLSLGYLEQLGMATTAATELPYAADVALPPAPKPLFTTEPERQTVRAALDAIRSLEKTTTLAGLSKPDVQAAIVGSIHARLIPIQGQLPGVEAVERERTGEIVAQVVKVTQENTIEIPRITVTPRDGAASGFIDFDLDTTRIRQGYVAQDILVNILGENHYERLRAGATRKLEARLEDYLVRT